MNKKYNFNNKIFNEWSNKLAYLIGWIVTDGCIEYIENVRYKLVFDLADKDAIEMIKDILDSNHPYHIYDREDKNSITYQLQLRNKSFIEDIMDMGITPNKTFDIEVPDIPNKYMHHFIRGVLDGDGSVFLVDRANNRKQLNTKITSASEKFIRQIGDILKKEVDLIPKIYSYSPDRTENTYYSLRYGGKESYKLYKYLYENADHYLPRKKEVFETAREIKAGIGLTNCKYCGKEIVRLSPTHKWCKDCKPIITRKRDRGEEIITIDKKE